MKKLNISKALSIILTLAMLFGVASFPALAEETLTAQSKTVSVDDFEYSNDELFAAFVESKMYDYNATAFATSNPLTLLTGDSQTLYMFSVNVIQSVCLNGGSTKVVLDFSDDDLMYTYTDKDGDLIDIAFEKVLERIDFNLILSCLLANYPYELYWFDKTEGILFSPHISFNETQKIAKLTSVTCYFSVSKEYQPSNYNPQSPTVTSDVSKVEAAVKNAKKLVHKNACKTDVEKLTAYKDYILNAVEYNYDAADSNAEYGNPWQLIWVFDNDPSTNVVCEGYAKAFSYLCELSDFRAHDFNCCLVSGVLSDSNVVEPHMWNTVKFDENVYIVDLTNTDSGMVGEDGELFLNAQPDGVGENAYGFQIGSQSVAYAYDEGTLSVYDKSELTLFKNTEPIKLKWLDYWGQELSGDEFPATIESGKTFTKIPKAPDGDENTIFVGWVTENNLYDFLDNNRPITASDVFRAKYSTLSNDLNAVVTLQPNEKGKVTLPRPEISSSKLLLGYIDSTYEIFKEDTLCENNVPIEVAPQYLEFNYDGGPYYSNPNTDDGDLTPWPPNPTNAMLVEGVQIRTSLEEGNNTLGLRFVSVVDSNLLVLLNTVDGISNVKYGAFLAKDSILQGEELNSQTKRAFKMVSEKIYRTSTELQDSYQRFTACVVNIPKEDLKTKIVIRPFVEYTDRSGVVRYIYGEQYAGADIYSVAQMAYENTEETKEVKDYLYENILSKAS